MSYPPPPDQGRGSMPSYMPEPSHSYASPAPPVQQVNGHGQGIQHSLVRQSYPHYSQQTHQQLPPASNLMYNMGVGSVPTGAVHPPASVGRSIEAVSYTSPKNGYSYRLEVVQQPVRARMCGFGDKDRRPITPPPALKLMVVDANGIMVDPHKVDASFFVLMVDLWSADGSHEVNLVRHSNSSPAMSISAATTTHFPPPPERIVTLVQTLHMPTSYAGQQPGMQIMHVPTTLAAMPLPSSQGPVSQAMVAPVSTMPQQMPGMQEQYNAGYGYPSQQMHAYNGVNGHHYGQAAAVMINDQPHLVQLPISPSSSMFTRNLIGSVVVNATKMNDDKNEYGIFFVLQDLSVRTEGSFRLKCSFVDVGDENQPSGVNQEQAPVLATCFSDQFQVYSAKKFPGVIESTALSKAFAAQGIKIPIRKDVKPVPNQDDFDRDNQDPSAGNV